MVLGSYYLTYERYPDHAEEDTYEEAAGVKAALKKGTINENSLVWVKNPDSLDDIPTYAGLAATVKKGELPPEILQSFSSNDEARLA